MIAPNASVLIVEDEPIVALDLQHRAGSLGYRVVGSAATGAEAVALCDELHPDLVLMDIRLEGAMDGIAAAERIRRDQHKPVVFLTAYSEDETLSRAALAEPYGYLLKPVEDRELKTTLEMALHKHRADREIRRLQRLYAMLSQVNQAIVRIRSREELYPAIVRLAVEFGRFQAARLDAYDPRDGSLALLEQAGVELGPPVWPAPGASPEAWRCRTARDAVATGSPARCHDLLAEAPPGRERAWAAGTGIRSIASVPFRFQGQPAGVLTLADGERGFFQAPEVRLLEETALDLSFALDQQEGEARRAQAEAALRRSEALLALVFDASQDLQLLVAVGPGDDFRIAAANRKYLEAVRHYGYDVTARELVGRTIEEAFLATFAIPREVAEPALRRYREVAASGRPMRFEEELETPGGRYVGEITLLPVPDEAGACAYVLYCSHDITARKREEAEHARLQAQLQQALKMESVGRLAGGVAHDFNNMLQSILGNADLALDLAPAGSPLREHLEEIQRSARHSADLTRQLLAFARKQIISPRVLDLNDTVAGLLRMLRRLIGEGIELAWRPGAAVWPIKMDPGQVDQILVNLCVNARDAIGGSGTVAIATDNVVLDEAFARDHPGCVPGDHARLTVSDTGVGMAPETRAHLFEPFFTTKEVGKGTGLGLATVFGIVTQNRGVVRVESELGRGSTFEIFIPRFEAAAGDVKPPEVRRAPGGRETVLLVEDEEQVLALSRRVLERLGYRVLAASTPAAALEQVAGAPEPIHLLVTDVVMPGMNGKELRDRLRGLYPGLRCLFMSGYTADVVAHHGVLDGGVVFVQKPFSLQEFAEKVREALA